LRIKSFEHTWTLCRARSAHCICERLLTLLALCGTVQMSLWLVVWRPPRAVLASLVMDGWRNGSNRRARDEPHFTKRDCITCKFTASSYLGIQPFSPAFVFAQQQLAPRNTTQRHYSYPPSRGNTDRSLICRYGPELPIARHNSVETLGAATTSEAPAYGTGAPALPFVPFVGGLQLLR
jgi:hypothetical protein